MTMESTGMDAGSDRCRLVDCPCGYGPRPEQPVIVAEAYYLGRDPILGTSILEVSAWLRECAVEAGWMQSEAHRQVLAMKLLQIREYVERGAFGWG
jgi:hypothetical protein